MVLSSPDKFGDGWLNAVLVSSNTVDEPPENALLISVGTSLFLLLRLLHPMNVNPKNNAKTPKIFFCVNHDMSYVYLCEKQSWWRVVAVFPWVKAHFIKNTV